MLLRIAASAFAVAGAYLIERISNLFIQFAKDTAILRGRRLNVNKRHIKLKLNSVALVRERTIPTERPPPVSEVSANFCG